MTRQCDASKISLRMVIAITGIWGLLSFLKGCSPEWRGGEGAGAVGGAFQSIGFFLYSFLLWGIGGIAWLLFHLMRQSHPTGRKVLGLISILFGFGVGFCPLILRNPFSRSDSRLLYLIPDGTISFSIAIGLMVIGAAALCKRQTQPR